MGQGRRDLPLFQIFLICVLGVFSSQAMAYPNFNGFGYNSCLACHYNPFGNGPLTDYGRGFAATALVSRVLYPKSMTEDDMTNRSGFFFTTPKNTWLRPSFGYRGLLLKRDFREDKEKTDYIHMQADAALVLKFGARDQYIVNGTIGYAPQPASVKKQEMPKYRSREHYIGWRPWKQFGMYAGLMDKLYGLRIPDHMAFSRSVTSLNQNDQTHGLLLHYASEDWTVGAHYMLGNYVQEEPTRQKGYSAQVEYNLSNYSNIGGSYLDVQSTYLRSKMWALHTRLGFGKGSSILMEFGQHDRIPVLGGTTKQSQYGLVQNYLLFAPGLFFISTLEYLQADMKKSSSIMRLGPGLQYFLTQRVELRVDFMNTRSFNDKSVAMDKVDFMGQVHLWF